MCNCRWRTIICNDFSTVEDLVHRNFDFSEPMKAKLSKIRKHRSTRNSRWKRNSQGSIEEEMGMNRSSLVQRASQRLSQLVFGKGGERGSNPESARSSFRSESSSSGRVSRVFVGLQFSE